MSISMVKGLKDINKGVFLDIKLRLGYNIKIYLEAIGSIAIGFDQASSV